MRIATWNIHGCVGTDRRFRPDRTSSVLQRLDADVIALQEVYGNRHGTEGFDGFDYFRRGHGPHAVAAHTMRDDPHDYGHMLCSRWPVDRAECHDISVDGREPRLLLDAVIHHEHGRMRILSTHLGLRARERRRQSAMLHRLLLRLQELPTIVLGDFNEVRRSGGVFRGFGEGFASPAAPATFPARRPLFALDRIWSRPAHLIRELWAWREDRAASDHLPVVADLHLGRHRERTGLKSTNEKDLTAG
jgi:endonuclease/exonuclease/phosphatase family metal-dependent hydrolase